MGRWAPSLVCWVAMLELAMVEEQESRIKHHEWTHHSSNYSMTVTSCYPSESVSLPVKGE